MSETKPSAMRRAVGLTVAAGAVMAGTVLAAPAAGADQVHQSTGAVLMKITPGTTDSGTPPNSCCNNGICNCKPNKVRSAV